MTDIVDGLGVGKGVFYWYFASKEELFRQILSDAQRDLRRAQRQAVADEPDPVRRIEAGIGASVAWLDDNRHLFVLLEFARTEERFAPLIRQGEEQAVADALPHVKAGIAAGMIRRDDPLVLAHAILGVTDLPGAGAGAGAGPVGGRGGRFGGLVLPRGHPLPRRRPTPDGPRRG